MSCSSRDPPGLAEHSTHTVHETPVTPLPAWSRAPLHYQTAEAEKSVSPLPEPPFRRCGSPTGMAWASLA
jgi:hypothetical protein